MKEWASLAFEKSIEKVVYTKDVNTLFERFTVADTRERDELLSRKNEADTRADLIDPKLVEEGWGRVDGSFIRRDVHITQGRIITGGVRSKPVISDYVLEYAGRKRAAIEAKKEGLSYTEGVRQAKDYALRLQCRIGYSTNGHDIYQIDLLTGKEGLVRDFINQYAVEKGWTTNSSYCVRVTANDGKVGEEDLEIFQDNEKKIPTILTTSRKLSTGVDARNIRNIVLMRQCKNMIEFKQIIGRGTRMYDGKDYFTVYDFVKAHHNFADPEWDGDPDPIEPSSCQECGASPCVCEGRGGSTSETCKRCDQKPCICEKPEPEPCETCGQKPCVCQKHLVIKLSDGRTRQIKHISSAMYWSSEGKPITAKESDVYYVLAFVAYAVETRTRVDRVKSAKPAIAQEFKDFKQIEFINFILEKYVEDSVSELATDKLASLVELKCNTMSDAISEFKTPAEIRKTFIGFQRFLYVR